MKWYEIIIAVIVFIVTVWLSMKAKDFHKNKYHNDSFKRKDQ